MKYILASSLIALSVASFAESPALRPELSVQLKAGNAQPFRGEDDYDEYDFSLNYDTSALGGRYYAVNASLNQSLEQDFGLIAGHYGQAWEKTHFGGVAGVSFGEVDGQFAGLEWGYTGERFNFDIRGTHWRLDGAPSNMNRIDIRAQYRIWNGLSAYYDYTHQFATKDGFKGDEFLYGLNYAFGNGQEIEIGMGNVHPQDTLSGASRVWTQYVISYKVNFGGKGRVDPVDLPNLYDF